MAPRNDDDQKRPGPDRPLPFDDGGLPKRIWPGPPLGPPEPMRILPPGPVPPPPPEDDEE
jgi:hypothetical protein